MTRRDWFSFADPAVVCRELDAGPPDLAELRPGVWGIPGLAVVCLGDQSHMRKVQAKRFSDRFHAAPCPKGYYDDDNGGPAMPTVAERLAKP